MIAEAILVCSVIAAVTGVLSLIALLILLWIKGTTMVETKAVLDIAKRHEQLNETQKVKTNAVLAQTQGALSEIREEGARTREAAKEAAKTVIQKAEEIKQVVIPEPAPKQLEGR